jgi:hypothetical protein
MNREGFLMIKSGYVIAIVVMLMIAAGCSSVVKSPTEPLDSNPSNTSDVGNDSHRFLLGVWEINFDPAIGQLTAHPDRSALKHYNITDYITPPQCDDCLDIELLEFQPADHYVKLKVSIRNPTQITVYDVRGIMVSNVAGMRLLNADAYTDLWDDGGDVTINPFRAFATDWPNREILPNTGHARIYEIEYTTLGDLLDILLVFDASWPGNCEEPYSITSFKQLGELFNYTGATVDIQLDVFDWQDNANSVLFSAPELTGADNVPFSYLEGNTWSAEITNSTGLEAGEYECLVKAWSYDSIQPLYQYVPITISEPLPFTIKSIDPDKGYRGSYLPEVVITGENIGGSGLDARLK